MLLAVETSGMTGSLAVFADGQIVAERMLESEGRRHAQTLVQETGQLLSFAGLKIEQLTAVAVSIGPGSFTGLRVGLVFAKTLSWLRGIPLLSVNTLQAIAQQCSEQYSEVLSISDAQRGEVFGVVCRRDGEGRILRPVSEVQVFGVADLPAVTVVAGPVVEQHRGVLEQLPGRTLVALSPWAATVAVLGADQLQRGQTAVPELLEPLYVRPSYAEEKRAAAGG
jgi:tRNA threonylcarbamoyladenosine biosynthesis protein TsaB